MKLYCAYVYILSIQVSVYHNSGTKHYKMTPSRKVLAKRIARRSYPTLCGSLVKSHNDQIIKQLSIAVRKELAWICSIKHNSVLRDGYDKMKQFSWDMLWSEFVQNVPTLVSLISAISPTSSTAVRCTIISIIVKQKHNKMALLQRMISMFFYGNSVHKQVCTHSILIFVVLNALDIHSSYRFICVRNH